MTVSKIELDGFENEWQVWVDNNSDMYDKH